MNKFDLLMKRRMEVLKMETRLHARYIDDIRVVMCELKKGSVITGDKVVIDPGVARADEGKSGEEVTARILLELMNGLLPGIRFTSEVEADLKDEWGMPTLDNAWRMGEI